MTSRVFVLSLLVLSLASTAPAAQPPDYLAKGTIVGTWQPLPAASGETAAWEILPDRIRLNIPPKSAAACSIACSDPVPDADWTMDLWTVCHFPEGYYSAEITLSIGSRGDGTHLTMSLGMQPNRASVSAYAKDKGDTHPLRREQYARGGAGPIHWIRISWSRESGRIKIRVNGQLVSAPDATASIPSAAPVVGFKASPREEVSSFEIISYRITPGAEPDTEVLGAAYDGWREPLTAEGLKSVPDLPLRLEKMHSAAGFTSAGRAYTLAAQMLSEKALTGGLGAETWKRVADFMLLDGQSDPAIGLCVLPVAAACGDPAQRLDVKSWADAYRGLQTPAWRAAMDAHRSLQRVALVDPVLASDISMAIDKDLHYRLLRVLIDRLSPTDPAYALATTVFFLGHDNFRCPKLAWMLPDLQAISPIYYEAAVQHLTERRDTDPSRKGEHDRSMSYAAYRLMSTDRQTAVRLLGLMKDPRIKAEAFQHLSETLTESHSDALNGMIEEGLKKSIGDWTESRSEPTPVPRYIRLAKWLQTSGRSEDAVATVRECTDKLGETSGSKFRSTREIAKMMSALKMPEAEEWTKKAMEYALAADAEGSDGGNMYITATYLTVTDLLAQGRTEEALSFAKRSDLDAYRMSREMIMTEIIQQISHTDMPRALELLEDYPQAGSRNSLVANLIRTMGGKDPEKARALFDTITPERRLEMALRIGDALPGDVTVGVFEDVLAKSLKGSEYYFGRYYFGGVDSWLARMDLAALFSLQPMFGQNPDRFAHEVLANIGNKCGLDDDWMWQCYLGVGTQPQGGPTPWGQELRRAVRAVSELEDGLF